MDTDHNFLELIDTHAHLDMRETEAESNEVISRSARGEFPELRGRRPEDIEYSFRMGAIICPGITADSSQKLIEFCKRSPLLHPAVGIHPTNCHEARPGDWEIIEDLARRPETVGIGETGLDLYWKDAPLELQISNFIRHLKLSRELDLPIIIHCRDAFDELMPILLDFGGSFRGILHSFNGPPELIPKLIDLGFHLSFSGMVTYPNRKFACVWEAAQAVPDDRLLIETDSPFLTPHPFRGKLEDNEPLMTALVAKRLAELRKNTVPEIVRLTAQNAKNLFRLT